MKNEFVDYIFTSIKEKMITYYLGGGGHTEKKYTSLSHNNLIPPKDQEAKSYYISFYFTLAR